MKKILYIDKFLTEDLYKKFSCLSLTCEYNHPNDGKRSFCSKNIQDIDLNLCDQFISHVKESLDIQILEYVLQIYKRKNSIYHPHIDGYPLQILIYLDGEMCNLNNGTFFMNDDEMALKVSNTPNSAIIFDGRIVHGSIQALSEFEKRGWRYSLNCFISKYK